MRHKRPRFGGLSPATFETFAEVTRRRAYHAMQRLCDAHRHGLPHTVYFEYGAALCAIGVMYDMGHPDAYTVSRRLESVRKATFVTWDNKGPNPWHGFQVS